ncbi:hypothetical protein LINGRAHAP2_LOCUS26985 [Linum grandiflorum]
MQRRPRARVSKVLGPVRKDQSSQPWLSVLRAPAPARSLPLPAQAGVGQLGRYCRAVAGGV